jgi:hypothetical protein
VSAFDVQAAAVGKGQMSLLAFAKKQPVEPEEPTTEPSGRDEVSSVHNLHLILKK